MFFFQKRDLKMTSLFGDFLRFNIEKKIREPNTMPKYLNEHTDWVLKYES